MLDTSFKKSVSVIRGNVKNLLDASKKLFSKDKESQRILKLIYTYNRSKERQVVVLGAERI